MKQALGYYTLPSTGNVQVCVDGEQYGAFLVSSGYGQGNYTIYQVPFEYNADEERDGFVTIPMSDARLAGGTPAGNCCAPLTEATLRAPSISSVSVEMPPPLPIGVDSFRKLREGGYYYVDKTRMINTLLDNKVEVTLITRPRRFGKTMNMDMLKEFFDITADSKSLFDGLEVMNGRHASELNSRPVLFFSFKDCKGSLPEIVTGVKETIQKGYSQYRNAVGVLDDLEQSIYQTITAALTSSDVGTLPINRAISFLSQMVAKYYQKPVVILIDEYDTPMSSAYSHGCYDELRGFFTTLFSTALKGNPSLDFAVMTGIQRIAKENIFSGLNNLDVWTVGDPCYSDCFGFTEPETRTLLDTYAVTLDSRIKSMYDGYRFGNALLYNPWSVLKYAQRKQLIPYWVNTSSNALIRSRLANASHDFRQLFDELILNGEVTVRVDLQTGTYEGGGDAALWGLFINAGYLTFADVPNDYTPRRRLRIPNGEVRDEFINIVSEQMGVERNGLEELFGYLVDDHNLDAFAKKYKSIITTITSYHDTSENAYHMLMLGMCVYLRGRYEIASNRETGLGRSDIFLRATKPGDNHIVIEFKQGNKNLTELADTALRQIEDKQYHAGLSGSVLLLGIAHHGKKCEIKYKQLYTNGEN